MDSPQPIVHCIPEEGTSTGCYIVSCPQTKKCTLIDTVMQYDPVSLRTTYNHANQVLEYLQFNELDPEYIIETHVHADHLTGAQFFKQRFPLAKTMIGFNVVEVQKTFKEILNLEDLVTDGSQFDVLIGDNQSFSIGNLRGFAIYTPGHTPACMTYVIGDAVFTGDTIFMPDFGTARCDFPGGSAKELYNSSKRLFEMPQNYRVFVGHDYGTQERGKQYETTVGAQKNSNKQLNEKTPEEEFVVWRNNRDSGLQLPRLIMQSLQVNLRNGKFPEAERNGVIYFKSPLNAFQLRNLLCRSG